MRNPQNINIRYGSGVPVPLTLRKLIKLKHVFDRKMEKCLENWIFIRNFAPE